MTTQHEDCLLNTDSQPCSASDACEYVTAEVNNEDQSPESTSDSSERSSSNQKYEEEWANLSRGDDPDLGELRRRAVLGNLRASRLRSLCWRILLGSLPPDSLLWLSHTRQCREQYAQLVHSLCVDPWQRDHPHDDPLSQSAESIWHQYFCDKELRTVIRQDVVRTFPGIDFFRKETIQDAMVNVLFCYAREHPSMCYRQGMHEVLAPLLFVLHCDHQAFLHTHEQMPVSDIVAELMDPTYLEPDAYMLFCQIMSGIESCYRIKDLTPTSTGYFPTKLSSVLNQQPFEGRTENEAVMQLTWIRDNLLQPHDPQLAAHLCQLDISLPLFGIRWLRLLFGREFPLQDLLVLWDAIFAEGQKFELVNYVVVSMLIAIRQQLLAGDYTTCLTYLMRYPGAVDITHIIEHALYLKDPQKYCQPAMMTLPNLPVFTAATSKELQSRKGNVAEASGTLSRRLKKLSEHPVKWVGRSHPAAPAGDADSRIVDGFVLDDPAVLRSKLDHAHDVMSLCRLKLLQYHAVLNRCAESSNLEAQQALDGIHELCSLLGPRPRRSAPPVEVEPALEAGETRVDKPPAPRPPRDVPLTLYLQSEGSGSTVIGAPLTDPLACIRQAEFGWQAG